MGQMLSSKKWLFNFIAVYELVLHLIERLLEFGQILALNCACHIFAVLSSSDTIVWIILVTK